MLKIRQWQRRLCLSRAVKVTRAHSNARVGVNRPILGIHTKSRCPRYSLIGQKWLESATRAGRLDKKIYIYRYIYIHYVIHYAHKNSYIHRN